jgi:hypothetical protein
VHTPLGQQTGKSVWRGPGAPVWSGGEAKLHHNAEVQLIMRSSTHGQASTDLEQSGSFDRRTSMAVELFGSKASTHFVGHHDEQGAKLSLLADMPRNVLRGTTLALAVGLLGLAGLTHSAPAFAASCPNEDRRVEQQSTYLPECRAFEQVSPAEKGEHDAVTMGNEEGFPVQASENGRAFGFTTPAPFTGPTKGGSLVVPYISERGPDGWETHSLGSPTPQRNPAGAAFSRYTFSSDLSRLTFTAPLQQLVSGAPADVVNLYTLNRADGSYSLLTSAPPLEPVPPGCPECFNERDAPAFLGASADYSRTIFSVNEGLTPGAPTGGGVASLYENVGGRVRLVGVLPDGTIPSGGSIAGAAGQSLLASEPYFFLSIGPSLSFPTLTGQVEHAISEDGSRIVFAAEADSEPDPEQSGTVQLYDRVGGDSEGVTDSEGNSTLELSKPAESAPAGAPAGPARFWAASPDGSHVLFTSRQELTGDSNTGSAAEGSDLYEATVATVAGETTRTDLVDLAPDPEGAGARVLGVVGASQNIEYVYFVGEGKLPGASANSRGAEAIEGEPNLYLSHNGSLTFIATLAHKPSEEPALPGEPERASSGESGRLRPGDESDWTPQAPKSQAYVTPDGRHLAFMSINSLTGAPSTGQITGRPVSEVYEYSAEGESLVCASCNPQGGRPIGNAYLGARNNAEGNGIELTLFTTATPLHHPRFMNDSGSELFFTSPDPGLVGESPGERTPDTHARIYEYSDGHASLISSPVSSLDEEFLDASESGEDVFISTRNRLVPEDSDNNGDIYDVAVGGGFPSHAVAACGGEVECRGQAPVSEGSPSTTSEVTGVSGNVPSSGNKQRASMSSSQQKKLKKALANCNRKATDKRASCKAAARKRYRPKHKTTKSNQAQDHNHRRAH